MEEEKTKTEGIKESASDLVDHVTDFLETYYQYIGINVAQKSVNLASGAINFVIVIFLCLLDCFFLQVSGLAWWLGDVINSRPGGFFIVAGFYFVIMIAMIVMRKKLIFPFLRNLITRKIYE